MYNSYLLPYFILSIIGILTPIVFWFEGIHTLLVGLNTIFWIILYLYEYVSYEMAHFDESHFILYYTYTVD